MITDFKIPEVGENIKSGTIVKLLVSVGSTVKKDQPLLEMETDKASLEVPSPLNGIIKEILVKEGHSVEIGQIVMKIESGAAASVSADSPRPVTKSPAAAPASSTPRPESRSTLPKAPAAAAPAFSASPTAMRTDIAAAPSVRRFAREIGVELAQVPGSGPRGRISLDDVKAFAKRLLSSGHMISAGATAHSEPLPDFAKFGGIERQPMNNIRKKTATHLSHAWQTIPHVTQFDKADITELEKARKQYSTNERKLTITPFLMKILAEAMKTFPQFNASVDMTAGEIIYKKYINIGVAVDTERGLLVPVIRNVDQKNILVLADELTAMAERARNKKVTLEDMQGGSMTITNLGGIGGTSFTPIVNWPEVAILGISRARLEPVYVESNFVPRLMLPLSLSYDHRLIDGADGARFIRWVAEAIEQPFSMEI